MSQKPLTYADAGVSIDAGNALVRAIGPLARSTARPGADAELGGFGGFFDLKAAGYSDPLLVAANDGVGTKLKLAIEIGRHDGVGIDLVAMCANDLIVQGAEPLFFLDYYATGKLEPAVASAVVASIAEGCRRAGCALIGGETAEHPGLLEPEEYDVAGAATGVVEADLLLGADRVRDGDVLVAMAASGLHSNGYSLVRHVLLERAGWALDRDIAELGRSLGDELLEPTRIYARDCLALIDAADVHAFSHITGGGLANNLARVLPRHLSATVDRATWSPPPIFGIVAEVGDVARNDLEGTLNMGVGMVAVVAASDADRTVTLLADRGVPSWIAGSVHSSTDDSRQVTLIGAHP